MTYELVAPIPAGEWRIVGDGIIIQPCDVQFDVVWRKAGGGDVTLASASHHFEPIGGGKFDATPFEARVQGPRADAAPGDLLVWRFTVSGTTAETAYIPNGDGAKTNGRIPFIQLP